MIDTITPTPEAMTGQDSLSVGLQKRFEEWLEARKPQEEKLLAAYSDAMRIPRDDDTKDTGASKAQKSKLFIGSTRGKIRSARAKIKDAMFGSNKMPFDTTPTNEELKDYADTVETLLTYQLEDMNFRSMLGGGINSLCTYGTAFIFGPFEKKKSHTVVSQVVDSFGGTSLIEADQEYRCPYYEHAPTMDVVPDPEASDVRDGLGVFWGTWKQPHEVRAWKKLPGYNQEAIDYALTQLSNNSSSEGSDRTTDQRANLYRFSRDGRIRVLRYFGLVKRADLAAWMGQPEQGDDEELIEAVVLMAGGVAIRADEPPYKGKKRPALGCVYEEVEHELWGVGIAENNEPHQKVVNAAFRLYVEGKAFALLKTCSIDRSKFEADEDFKLFPGKKFKMRSGLTPDERKTAILWHDVADVTQGWENVIGLSEKFSDDDTGISKYTQGNDADHLNKTATGVSMIMNASSLPLKEVIQNIDSRWIEQIIEGLIDWNLEHMEPEIVGILIGEKYAQKWAEIKQFGKTSFMNWKATGSSTFMAKEVLMNKLQGFMQLSLGNPLTANLVDARELLEQVWEAGEIGKESPVYDEETLKQKQGPQIPQEVQEQMQGMQQALRQSEQQMQFLEQQLAAEKANKDVQLAKIQSDERLRMQELMIKDRDSRVNAEQKLAAVDLTEAQTDLAQAQATAALTDAQLAPSKHMLDVAEAVNEAQRTDAINKNDQG